MFYTRTGVPVNGTSSRADPVRLHRRPRPSRAAAAARRGSTRRRAHGRRRRPGVGPPRRPAARLRRARDRAGPDAEAGCRCSRSTRSARRGTSGTASCCAPASAPRESRRSAATGGRTSSSARRRTTARCSPRSGSSCRSRPSSCSPPGRWRRASKARCCSRELVLAPLPPRYRDPAFPLPSVTTYFRPFDALPAPHDGSARVYVTLGTVFNLESGDLFSRVLAGWRSCRSRWSRLSVPSSIRPSSGSCRRTCASSASCRRRRSCRAAAPLSPTAAPGACSARSRTRCRLPRRATRL